MLRTFLYWCWAVLSHPSPGRPTGRVQRKPSHFLFLGASADLDVGASDVDAGASGVDLGASELYVGTGVDLGAFDVDAGASDVVLGASD